MEETWHGIEVAWSAGDGDGSFELRLDGIVKFMTSNLSNNGSVINEADLGGIDTPTASGLLTFDAFDLRRTPEVGLLAINEMFGISARADVQTGDNIVIGSFIVTGDTDRCVVVRGRGLTGGEIVGISSPALSDPYLALYDLNVNPPEELDNNNNWGDFPEAQTIQDLGLEPPDSDDAAIYACLPPGAYSGLLSGFEGAEGIGIVEVYDADTGTPYMFGISSRSFIGTGDYVAIGGFIIDGDQPKEVVVRGRGPSVGVPPVLSDPKLRVFDSVGVEIDSNDNWQEAPNADQIAGTDYVAGLDPADAALLIQLNPGLYTFIVEGVAGATGIGIVEIYDKTGGTVAAQ